MILRKSSLAWAVIASIAGWACGGSSTPTTPSVVQVGGTWAGSIDSSNFPSQTLTMTLTQTGATVSGTWSAPVLQWNGAVTGSVSGDAFNGSFTLVTPNATGGTCTGTATTTGTASSASMLLTSTGFIGPCGGMPTTVRISVRKS